MLITLHSFDALTYSYNEHGWLMSISKVVSGTASLPREYTYNNNDGNVSTKKDHTGEGGMYAYCANNPVNYTDPSGHVAQAVAVRLAVKGLAGIFGALSGTTIAPVLGGVLIATAFTYVTVKVKRKLQEELPSVVMGLSVRAAKIAIDASTVEAKRLAKPRKANRKHNHHIVPKTAKKCIYAVRARGVLKRVHIDVNSTKNLVRICDNVHSLMHTYKYYEGVYRFINRKKVNRKNVILRLQKLKVAIKALDNAINGVK